VLEKTKKMGLSRGKFGEDRKNSRPQQREEEEKSDWGEDANGGPSKGDSENDSCEEYVRKGRREIKSRASVRGIAEAGDDYQRGPER